MGIFFGGPTWAAVIKVVFFNVLNNSKRSGHVSRSKHIFRNTNFGIISLTHKDRCGQITPTLYYSQGQVVYACQVSGL